MALLRSLEICGIRSFSPDNKEVISFNTPVTLFLGQNGCGKTTIIESIRFALTGDLPPGTTNGQGFVNDPKMSNRVQTKASIKIKFIDSTGCNNTLARYMSVSSQTGGKLTFKNLQFTLRKHDKDDPDRYEDISGRCVDINAYCSNALNVSKSILNNVLFCHQENSCWPLDEPKKLKEKFDEIFDATRYNKCVDHIRKLTKEKHQDLKVLKEKLSNKLFIKGKVEKERARMNAKQTELETLNDAIKDNETKMKPMEERMKKILELEDNLTVLQRKLSGKENDKKSLKEQQANIRKELKGREFDGTDEDLKEEIKNFEEKQLENQNTIKDLTKKRSELATKSVEHNAKIQKTQISLGQLRNEKKIFEETVDKVKSLINDLSLNLETSTSTLDREDAIETLSEALKNYEKRYESLAKEKDSEEEKLQEKIDKIREAFTTTSTQISSKNNLMSECETKIREIKSKINELESSSKQLDIAEEKLKKLQNDLKKTEENFDEEAKVNEIQEIEEIIENKGKYLEKLDNEYRIHQENYVNESNLEREKNIVIQKESNIVKIKLKHSNNLKNLFNNDIPEKNFKQAVSKVQADESVKEKRIQEKIGQLERNLTTFEANIQHLRLKLETSKSDVEIKRKKVNDLTGGKEFKQVLLETENKREKLQKDKGMNYSAKVLYESFIEQFSNNKKSCPICHSDFTEKPSAINQIISRLNDAIKDLPNQIKTIDDALKKVEIKYNELQQLQPINDEIEEMIKNKIPSMEKELVNLKQQEATLKLELSSQKRQLVEPQEKLSICSTFLSEATLLDQFLEDVEKAKISIKSLEKNIKKLPSNRSRQEVEAEIDLIKAELSNKKNMYNSFRKMLENHRERCQNLRLNIQREIERQLEMKQQMEQKPLLESQLTELDEKLTILMYEIEQLNDLVAEQRKEKTSAEEEKTRTVRANRKFKDAESKKISNNRNLLNKIQELQLKIVNYEKNDIETKLKDTEGKLETFNEALAKLDETKNKISDMITQKREELASQGTEHRILTDNLLLREQIKKEHEVDKEIKELNEKIGGYNYRQVYEEKEKIQRFLDKKKSEINTLTGKKEEIEKNINEIKQELELPHNKNAYDNYCLQYYEVIYEESAIRDMSQYVDVLEKAILKYHEERMVQINRMVKELWRDIYTGNDIDYIQIKNDEPMAGGVNRRRTYSYKVVQIKNNVELEMRGRCSAGQKVLASLVIRIALAETFSSHCGILALDEPTTNLDHSNILSLSDGLSRIISSRGTQKNFQLLIITHDEEFLNTLTRDIDVEYYWKVERDQRGFSKVTRNVF